MKCVPKMLLSAIAVLGLGASAYGQENASAIVNLKSINGSGASQTFTYAINLTDTGTTNISTFWYAWLPPDNFYDFLKSTPTSEGSPSGWTANLEGENRGTDGNSIQWVTTSSPLTHAQTLTFNFTTPDNFATVTGPAFGFSFYPTGYSYIYSGAPEADTGNLVTVAAGSSVVPEPSGPALALLAGSAFCFWRPRRAALQTHLL